MRAAVGGAGVFGGVMAERVILIVLGGLFGWLLGKLPAHWVYAVAAAAIVGAIVVFGR